MKKPAPIIETGTLTAMAKTLESSLDLTVSFFVVVETEVVEAPGVLVFGVFFDVGVGVEVGGDFVDVLIEVTFH